MVPQQTERLQGGQEPADGFERARNQVERGHREALQSQKQQRSEAQVGTQGQRTAHQDHRKKRKDRRSREEEKMIHHHIQITITLNQHCIYHSIQLFGRKRMIFGQLPGKSPEKRTRSVIKALSGTAVFHMTCLQLNKVRLVYDDTYYQNCPVTKAVLIVQIMQYQKGQSPRGMQTINLKIKDSTGRCNVTFYHSEQLELLCKSDEYMKLGVKIKCGGEVYRPAIKIMGTSIVQLLNYNELTQHYLECMQTQLKTE